MNLCKFSLRGGNLLNSLKQPIEVLGLGYNCFVRRRNRAIHIIFAVLYLLLANDKQALAADERFAEAESFYSQKNYSASEKLLKEVLSTNQNHTASLYLLGNIYVLQKRIDEATQAYRACVKSGADTRPGQYAAMALSQIEEAHKSVSEEIQPKIASPRAAQQEEERQTILKAQKEAIARNQRDFKIQADKLTLEEEQQIELAPSNQAEWRNTEYRLVRENAVAQIKQEFEAKKKALKEIYDRKENAINLEFKRRLAPFGAI
jgi:cytochrome c-type biogenesis protein CcmH/NrfG